MSWSAFFDSQASAYDDYTVDDWHPNRHVGELLVGLPVAARSILDLGAGTGQTASMLRSLFPAAEMTLVDPSPRMAQLAQAKHPNARVLVTDADSYLTHESGVYDLITGVGFLEFVPAMEATLASARQRLSVGGHLAVTYELLLPGSGTQGMARSSHGGDGRRWVRRYSPAHVREVASSLGLQRAGSRQFTAYRRSDTHDDVIYEAVVWRRPA